MLATTDLISKAEELWEAGQFLKSWELLEQNGGRGLAFSNPRIGCLAARLLKSFGWRGCGIRLLRTLRAKFPEDTLLELRWIDDQLSYHRFDVVIQWLHETRDAKQWPKEFLAEFWSTRASIHTQFRDFFKAERAIRRGLEHAPDHVWLRADRLHLLVQQDKHQEALELAEQEIVAIPERLRVRHFHAWLLFQLNREKEALHAFETTLHDFESPAIGMALAAAASDLGDFERGIRCYESILERFPQISPSWKRGLHYGLAKLHKRAGNTERAIQHTAHTGKWAEELQAMLQKGDNPWQVLEVPFQIQSSVTCAPASAAAILGYWGNQIDHSEIAKKITYDGTHDTDLIDWLEDAGFVVRPFTLEEGLTQKLIQLELPFSLSVRYIKSGHRFTVVGYDACMKSLIVLDPGGRYLREAKEKELLEEMQARGCCGLLILPPALAEKYADLELPLEARHQTALDLQRAAMENKNERVEELMKVVRTWEPSPLAWECRRSEAWRRSSISLRLETATEARLAFPKDGSLALEYAEGLEAARQFPAYWEFLKTWSKKIDCPGELVTRQAQALFHQPGGVEQGWKQLHHAMYLLGSMGAPFAEAASQCWADPERRHLAMPYARAAACANPTDESTAQSYADFCTRSGQPAEGMRFLEERAELYQNRSAYPLVTLAGELASKGKRTKALEVLARPFDGDPVSHAWLIQRRFDHLRLAGKWDEAEELLQKEGSRLRPNEVNYAQAELARSRGDLQAAISHMESCVLKNPETTSQWEDLLNLLFAVNGRQAFQDRCHQLLADPETPSRALEAVYEAANENLDFALAAQALDQMEDSPPSFIWLRGSRNRLLLAEGRYAEALPEVLQLTEGAPYSIAAWSDLAEVHHGMGKRQLAQEAFRECARLAPNDPGIAQRLLDTAEDLEDRKRLLIELQQQCFVQDPNSAFVRAMAVAAIPVQGVPVVIEWLQKLAQSFPLNTGIPVANLVVLMETGRLDEAEELAKEQFELDPERSEVGQLWADLLGQLGRLEQKLELLSSLCERFPFLAGIRVERCLTLESLNRYELAQEDYLAVEIAFPESEAALGCFADLLWRLGQREQALQKLERACELSADYTWAWRQRVEWLGELDRKKQSLEVAQRQVCMRPGTATAHALLAHACAQSSKEDEELAAWQRAVELDPRSLYYRVQMAEWLHRRGRFDEAKAFMAQCREELGNHPAFAAVEGEILRVEGELDESRKHLRAALLEFPDDIRSWHTYLDWLDDDGKTHELIKLAQKPPLALAQDFFLWSSTASALIKADDEEKAVPYLKQAWEMEPDNPWALSQLLMHYRDKGDKAAAQEILPQVNSLAGLRADLVVQITATFAWLKDDRAQDAYVAMLDSQTMTPQFMKQAWQAGPGRRYRKRILIWVREALENSQDIWVWGNAIRLHLEAKSKRELPALLERFEQMFADQESYVQELAKILRTPGAQRSETLLTWAATRMNPPINNVDLWGVFGYFFAGNRSHLVLQHLLPDFRRPDAQAWMLSNLVDVLIETHDLPQARQVLQHAHSKPRDGSHWYLRLHQAEIDFLEGDYHAVINANRMEEEMETQDVIRSKTLTAIAKASLAKGYWQRRRILREFLQEMHGDIFSAYMECPLSPNRDLRAKQWFRLAPGLDPLLLRMGKIGAILLLIKKS